MIKQVWDKEYHHERQKFLKFYVRIDITLCLKSFFVLLRGKLKIFELNMFFQKFINKIVHYDKVLNTHQLKNKLFHFLLPNVIFVSHCFNKWDKLLKMYLVVTKILLIEILEEISKLFKWKWLCYEIKASPLYKRLFLSCL